MQTITREITDPVRICRADGRLNPAAEGWSRHPLHIDNMRGRFPRKKRWEYWCITSDKYCFSVTIAHIDFAGFCAAYFLENETGAFTERTGLKLFPRTPRMPAEENAPVSCRRERLRCSIEKNGGAIRIRAESPDFGGHPMIADIQISRPPGHETLNVLVPWNRRTFQFTSKQQALPASGKVVIGGREYAFEAGASFGCLDYGRGIWPRRVLWNWAAFSGCAGRDVIGINLGARWTDGTGMTENGIVVNGRLLKIFDDVRFEYDPGDFMRPWRLRTVTTDEVDLEMIPFYDRSAASNLLLVSEATHQVFGRFRGVIRPGNRELAVDNIIGWAEEVSMRW
jgi:hypothetical protein